MKQSQSGNGQQSQSSQTKTENKDNLDSRHQEEDTVKGDHTTHNKQEQHSTGKSQKQQQS